MIGYQKEQSEKMLLKKIKRNLDKIYLHCANKRLNRSFFLRKNLHQSDIVFTFNKTYSYKDLGA